MEDETKVEAPKSEPDTEIKTEATKKPKNKPLAATLTSSQDTPAPTIGRIVHYAHMENDGINPLAAIITNVARVGEITVVCLAVFDSLGSTFGVQSVKQGTGPGEWMYPART